MRTIDSILAFLAQRPMIIDEGTSGIWTYRKWSDGRMEMLTEKWSTGSVTFAAWGNQFYKDVTGPAIPSGFFISAPTAFVTSWESQAPVWGLWSTTTTSVGTIRFVHNSTSSSTCYCNIYLIGKWKN